MIPELPPASWLMRAYGYAKARTKLPDECVFWLVMAYAGAAIQDRMFVDWAGKPVYPNVPLLLVTPSGYGKTSAMHLVERLFGRELPYKIPEDSTAESAVKMMSRNSGTYFRNSVALWSIPELADIFGKKDYQQGLIARVTRILDNPRDREVSRSTKDEVIRIPGVAVLTWIAGTTFKWLSEHVDEAVSAGGFLPRMFVVNTDDNPKNVPNPERDELAERELQNELRNILANLCLRDPLVVRLSDYPEWFEYYNENYEALVKHKDDEIQPFISRRDENTLRIFMILKAVADCRNLSQAKDLALSIEESAYYLSIDLRCRNVAAIRGVLRRLRQSQNRTLSFRELCKNTHIDAGVLIRILGDLRAQGTISWDGQTGSKGLVVFTEEE